MANGGFTVAQANLIMTKYKNLVIDCIPKASGEFNKIPVESVKSNRFEYRVKVAGTASMGNAVEAQDFQAPGSPVTLSTFSGYTIFQSNHQLSDVAKAVIDGSETNFDSAMRFLSDDAMDQALLFREGFLYGDGTAECGTVSSVSGNNVRVIGYANGRSQNPSVLLWPNASYAVYDTTLATLRGTVTITSKNVAPQDSSRSIDCVTTGLPAGTVATDRLFWIGTGSASSFGLAPQGLNSLIDANTSGTFQGVDFTANPLASVWTSSLNGGGGTLRALTPTILMSVLQAQGEVYTGRSIDNVGTNLQWITHVAQALPFYNMFPGSASQNTPYVTRPDDKTVGSTSRTFAGPLGTISMNFRRECPPSNLYGVDYSNLINAERLKLNWRSPSMFQLSQFNSTSNAQLYAIFQLAVKERRHMVKVTDLSYVWQAGNRG